MQLKNTLWQPVIIGVVLLLIIGWTVDIQAGPVADTGQTRNYHEGFQGLDHAYQINPPSYTKLDDKGVPLPDNAKQWAMVRDDVTGLIWEVKTRTDDIHFRLDTYTWEDAHRVFIKGLNETKFGGASDWRLPSAKELARITHKDRYMPAVDEKYFPATHAHDYWTATPYAKDSGYAWRVHFCRGFVMENPKAKKFYVRAVHGPCETNPSLVDNGDGTITDPGTGLMWQQAYGNATSWSMALNRGENLQLAGYSDWRLPNTYELQSLVNYNRSWPAVDSAIVQLPKFENMARPIAENASGFVKKHGTDKHFEFWSSTTYASNSDRAWTVGFKNGRITIADKKKDTRLIRAVRGGQQNDGHKLLITSPLQGAFLSGGQTATIAWEHCDLKGTVEIALSVQGGRPDSFTTVIANAAPNSGQFKWIVPDRPSVNCALRIRPTVAPDKVTTQGLFSIQCADAKSAGRSSQVAASGGREK